MHLFRASSSMKTLLSRDLGNEAGLNAVVQQASQTAVLDTIDSSGHPVPCRPVMLSAAWDFGIGRDQTHVQGHGAARQGSHDLAMRSEWW